MRPLLWFIVITIVGILSYRCGGDSIASDHSFVFLTGWPQSGTSLVQQFMSSCPDISTMMQKCEDKLGKRCVSWNHEGQWLLPGKTRQFFNSGAMCPLASHSLSLEQRNTILHEWGEFWSLDKPYLAEKSPQSLLKIPLLRQIAKDSKRVRIVIILKNPVTLNIATPKNSGWAFLKSDAAKQLSEQAGKTTAEKVKVSMEQMVTNANFFLDFMVHNRSNITTAADCSMGWLPAMETLHQQLTQDINTSLVDVRIVRYEQFEKPNRVCRELFRFIYDSNTSAEYNRTITKVCNVYFPNSIRPASSFSTASASTSSSSSAVSRSPDGRLTVLRPRGGSNMPVNQMRKRPGQSRRLSNNNISSDSAVDDSSKATRRYLRLRNYQDTKSFQFIPELVTSTGRERIREYRAALERLPSEIRAQLGQVDKRLRRFGYSLNEWMIGEARNNLLTPWEIQT